MGNFFLMNCESTISTYPYKCPDNPDLIVVFGCSEGHIAELFVCNKHFTKWVTDINWIICRKCLNGVYGYDTQPVTMITPEEFKKLQTGRRGFNEQVFINHAPGNINPFNNWHRSPA